LSAAGVPEPARARPAFAFLIVLLCADLLRSAAQLPEPQQATVAANLPPVVEPRKFSYSDGTISNSQDECLIAVAKARLPPPQIGQAQ
jgi:hypothetical protein